MKSAYVKPTMMFEGFQPTEYVAACYKVNCLGSGYYEETRHTCNGGEFIVKDGEHGNHQDTLYGTATDVLVRSAVSNWGEVVASFATHIGSKWLIGQPGDWDSFWASFNDQTVERYIYDGHISESPSYNSYSNFS